MSNIIVKELGDNPKVYIWNGEGDDCLYVIQVSNFSSGGGSSSSSKVSNGTVYYGFQNQTRTWAILLGLTLSLSQQTLLV